jgi:hypothetical protein
LNFFRFAFLAVLVAGCGGPTTPPPGKPGQPIAPENQPKTESPKPAATAPVREMPSGWWVDVEDGVNKDDVGTGGYFLADGFKLAKTDGTLEQVKAAIVPDGENRWKLTFPGNDEADVLALVDGGRGLTLTRPNGTVVKFRIASVAETDKFNGAH